MNQRPDVEVDHFHLAVEHRRGERPATAEASIVDQEVDLLAIGAKAFGDGCWRTLVGQVRRDARDMHAVSRGQLGRQLFQPIAPPRHQHQVMAVLGRKSCQLTPDPSRSATVPYQIFDGSTQVGTVLVDNAALVVNTDLSAVPSLPVIGPCR